MKVIHVPSITKPPGLIDRRQKMHPPYILRYEGVDGRLILSMVVVCRREEELAFNMHKNKVPLTAMQPLCMNLEVLELCRRYIHSMNCH